MDLLPVPSLLSPHPRTERSGSAVAITAADEVGMAVEPLRQAVRLAERRGARAQLCVLRHGRPVLDAAIGCPSDGLFWIFSASKPYTTVLIHLLAEQGLFSLSDRVATYWPEFGRYGKDRITIDQVLQHRTGFATAGGALADMMRCTDWHKAVRAVERARPRRPAGGAPAYQFLIFGVILGELVQRISGRPYAEVLADRLLAPLQVADTHLGIGPELFARHVPVEFRHPGGRTAARAINRPHTRQAVLPSAGVSTTARDLARFYQLLLDGGRVGRTGPPLISAAAIARARTPSTSGEIDRFVRAPVPWSHGFQLGGLRGPGHVPPFGFRSSRGTFGHNGSNCCVAWADVDRDLAFAYLTNLRTDHHRDMAHHAAVADLIFAACRD